MDEYGLPTKYECFRPECRGRLSGEIYLHCHDCYDQATVWFEKMVYNAEVSEPQTRRIIENRNRRARMFMLAADRKRLNRMSRWQRRMLEQRFENE